MTPIILFSTIVFLGLIIPVIILLFFSKKSFRSILEPFILGAGLLVFTLLFQPVLQSIPKFIIDINKMNIYFVLYASLVSGFFQETLKALAIKRYRDPSIASWVGVGFGGMEAVYIGFSSTLYFLGNNILVPFRLVILSSYERFLATVFHIGSSIVLSLRKYSLFTRIIITSFFHTAINFIAVSTAVYSKKAFPTMSFGRETYIAYLGITFLVIVLYLLAYRWGGFFG